jgi:hypothetical protein
MALHHEVALPMIRKAPIVIVESAACRPDHSVVGDLALSRTLASLADRDKHLPSHTWTIRRRAYPCGENGRIGNRMHGIQPFTGDLRIMGKGVDGRSCQDPFHIRPPSH